jgi:hypothetical protein
MLLHVISAVLDLLFVGAAQRHVVLTVGWTWCTYGARRRIFILHIYMHTHTHTHTHTWRTRRTRACADVRVHAHARVQVLAWVCARPMLARVRTPACACQCVQRCVCSCILCVAQRPVYSLRAISSSSLSTRSWGLRASLIALTSSLSTMALSGLRIRLPSGFLSSGFPRHSFG